MGLDIMRAKEGNKPFAKTDVHLVLNIYERFHVN